MKTSQHLKNFQPLWWRFDDANKGAPRQIPGATEAMGENIKRRFVLPCELLEFCCAPAATAYAGPDGGCAIACCVDDTGKLWKISFTRIPGSALENIQHSKHQKSTMSATFWVFCLQDGREQSCSREFQLVNGGLTEEVFSLVHTSWECETNFDVTNLQQLICYSWTVFSSCETARWRQNSLCIHRKYMYESGFFKLVFYLLVTM